MKKIKFYTYSRWRFTLLWSLVLIRSNGWNKIVENVPDNDPARKDFKIGY